MVAKEKESSNNRQIYSRFRVCDKLFAMTSETGHDSVFFLDSLRECIVKRALKCDHRYEVLQRRTIATYFKLTIVCSPSPLHKSFIRN